VNYKFNKTYASKLSSVKLFSLVTVLIEIQHRANLYRSGYKKHKLKVDGICGNIYSFNKFINKIICNDVHLNVLFFKDNSYPIYPFHPPHLLCSDATILKYRWGNTKYGKGDERMKMLEYMITDLTEYLTNKHKQK
jgi:hypothetical protein